MLQCRGHTAYQRAALVELTQLVQSDKKLPNACGDCTYEQVMGFSKTCTEVEMRMAAVKTSPKRPKLLNTQTLKPYHPKRPDPKPQAVNLYPFHPCKPRKSISRELASSFLSLQILSSLGFVHLILSAGVWGEGFRGLGFGF